MAAPFNRDHSFSRSDEQSLQAYQHAQHVPVSPIDGTFSSPHAGPPPPPPAHSTPYRAYSPSNSQYRAYSPSPSPKRTPSDTTPDEDHLGGRAAGGGITGLAAGVAGSHERESGQQALRDIEGWGRNRGAVAAASPFTNPAYEIPPRAAAPPSRRSAVLAPGMAAAGGDHYPYRDDPYNRFSSSNLDIGTINPNDIADDDDYGTGADQPKRRSFLGFGGSNSGSRDGTPGAAGAAAGSTVALGAIGRDPSGTYNAVPGSNADGAQNAEKSEWLKDQNSGNKKLKWLVGTLVVLVVIGAVVGGVLGTLLGKKKSSSSTAGSPAAVDNTNDLDKDSSEIKALMNNPNLHRVFPGVDYTPLNTQYPDCLHNPPSQNNVTRDMAVLSQLTNAVRLYGTDCNQTEMVLHAIDKLALTSMKVWLGVWVGNNDTTNTRQMTQMWDIVDKNDASIFKGVIVGNEVLFRKDRTLDQLGQTLSDVRSNLTSKNKALPVATSDLGDNWTADLASKVDIVMSNIHPFFAGVTADQASGWTWDFWTQHDVDLTKNSPQTRQIISEVGWPSAGGNDCGDSDCTNPTQGSIAGIDEMNTFMNNFICQSLKNKTEYFWYAAFLLLCFDGA